MDKLKIVIKDNKKGIIFLIGLTVIGLASGSIFSLILNNNDKQLVNESIGNFLNSINSLNYLSVLKSTSLEQTLFVLLIWLLGFSIIGIPIILFSFFLKIFTLGFSISSLITIYKVKGILLSLLYIFPHHIINTINYFFLTIVSLKISISLVYAIFKRKKIDFKPIIGHYLVYLLISMTLALIAGVLEVYLMPFVMNFFL